MCTSTDILLWNQFLSGDDKAYATIYEQHVQSMYAYGMHFTSDSELVKDCIHDIFVKIYQNKKNLQPTDNIRLYLFIALKNRLFNIFRKDVEFCQIDTMEPVFAADYTIEDRIIDDEQTQLLNEKMIHMLEVLTPRQKEVIYYRYVESLSYDEIEKIMGMNYQSIQNLVHRSLKKLRNTFSNVEFALSIVLFFCFSRLF